MKTRMLMAAYAASSLALAAGEPVTCPPSIEVKQEVLRMEGWTAHIGTTPHKFYFAQFSDGPPSRQAILLNDKESRSGKDKVLHYSFLPSQEPWLICSYTGTNAVLARRLAPAISSCRLTLDHARNFATVKGISCGE